MTELFENGEIPDSLSKQIMQALKKITGDMEDSIERYHTIYDAIPSLYFDGRKEEQAKKISKSK